MSDSVRPHGWQPTRLPRPWDSPGKNTGVGCHFLLQCVKVKSESEVAESCPTLSDPMDCGPPGSLSTGFSRQEYWSGVPLPSPAYFPLNISACLSLTRAQCLEFTFFSCEANLKTVKYVSQVYYLMSFNT